MSLLHNALWVERYRPQTIADCILPAGIKSTFQQIVSDGQIPNLLLSGPAGTGKTSVAKAMCQQMNVDRMVINGSLRGNIDTLRNEIQQYASSVSMMEGGRKCIILDEADYLNANSTQPALRNFMEEFSQNCAFVLTCNFRNRIIEPLQSRCALIEFSIPKEERGDLVAQYMKRLILILHAEGVEHDLKAVAVLLKKHFPDMRKIINELQRYAKIGKIDSGILAEVSNTADLINHLKNSDFAKMRAWVAENADLDFSLLVTELYKVLPEHMDSSKVPHLVLNLNKYDYQNSFVSNKEVNTAAMLTEILADCF